MNPELKFQGVESINILLRVLDDTIKTGIVGIATIAEVVFILMLTLSLTFMLGHYAAGHGNLPRTLVTKMVMVWFLGIISTNWLALLNLVGDTFTNWGIALGGNTLAIGSFRQPAYLLLTCFELIKNIWSYGTQGCRGVASCAVSLFTIGWYFLASVCILIAFYFLIRSIVVALVQFKVQGAISLLLVCATIWKGSAFLGEKAFGGIFANALKLMVLGFFASFAVSFFNSSVWPAKPDYLTAALIAFCSGMFVWLFNQADAIAAGIINAGPSIGGQSLDQTVGSAIALGSAAAASAAGSSAAHATAALPAGGAPARLPAGIAGSPGSNGAAPKAMSGANGFSASAIMDAKEKLMEVNSASRSFADVGDIGQSQEQRMEGMKRVAGELAETASPEVRDSILAQMDNIEHDARSDEYLSGDTAGASGRAAGQYESLINRVLDTDGIGGVDRKLAPYGDLSLEGRDMNAALAQDLGIGPDVARMTAAGKSNREIANVLGERMRPVEALAREAGQGEYGDYQKMAVIQAYKDTTGIPNHADRDRFKAWKNDYEAGEKSNTPSPVVAPLQRGEGFGRPPNQQVLPPVRRLTPYNPNRFMPPAGNPSASMTVPIREDD
jgi:type IV secretory pathway TrbL component